MSEENSNELREIAFRKIGRNIVNLQRFERMLKLIIVNSNISGYASELAKAHQDKTKVTSPKTLGPLVGEFLNTVYSTDDPFTDGPDNPWNHIWMSHGFRIRANVDSISKTEVELREVVEERNLLIHHLLAEVDFGSVDECQQLISRLDAQNDRLMPHFDSLMHQLGDMRAAQEALRYHLLAELRQSSATDADND
jgi:hypothetical protein